MTDFDEGVCVVETADGAWAWVGVSVEAAADIRLTVDSPAAMTDRLGEVRQQERAYVSAIRDRQTTVRLRWIINGGDPVQLAVLGATQGRTAAEVGTRAAQLRSRLVQLPRHVTGSAVTSAAEVSRLLNPFAPARRGMVDLRKRWFVQRAQRPDSPWPVYLSAPWLPDVASLPWPTLLETLRSVPQRIVLDVGLRPVPVDAVFRQALSERATVYGRLAREGEQSTDGLFTERRRLSADSGAVVAEQLFADAVQRYAGDAFALQVSLVSDAPLEDDLADFVRDVLSPAEDGDQGILTARLGGVGLERARPSADDEELAIANFDRLASFAWGGPELPPAAAPEYAVVGRLGQLVDVREAASLFRFPVALHGSLPGFPVERARESGIVHVRSAAEGAGLQVGQQRDTSGRRSAVTVDLPALTSHGLVVGTTGSGKTNTVLSLLQQLWAEHKIPFLIIEPVNSDLDDYRWLLDQPGFDDMRVFTVGDEGLAPFRFNPFEVPRGVRVGTYLASLVSCFDAAFGLEGPLPFLYRKALKHTYIKAGIAADEISGERHVGRWPVLRDLVDAFEALPDIDRYAGEVKSNINAASRLRAESLLVGSCGRTLGATTSFPLDQLLAVPTVLELAAIGDDDREQALIIALLLNALTSYYKSTRTTGDLAHVTVIEEAHRLLRRPAPVSEGGSGSSGRAAEQFANTLAENRKYGEGLLIVEQVPGKLIEDAVKNTALKVMHHLPSEDDRSAVSDAMNLGAEQTAYARSLNTFEAFVTHRGMGGRSALIEVTNVRAQLAGSNKRSDPVELRSIVRSRFEDFLRERPDLAEGLKPYAGCAGCRYPCQFRGIAEVQADNPGARQSVLDELPGERLEPAASPVWTRLADQFEVVADEFVEFDRTQRQDLAVCSFMHTAQALFVNDRRAVAAWTARVRSAAMARSDDE